MLAEWLRADIGQGRFFQPVWQVVHDPRLRVRQPICWIRHGRESALQCDRVASVAN